MIDHAEIIRDTILSNRRLKTKLNYDPIRKELLNFMGDYSSDSMDKFCKFVWDYEAGK